MCLFVCLFVWRVTPLTIVGRLHPYLLHRINMTPINVWGCFYLCQWSWGEGEGTQILHLNVYHVAPPQGGGGHNKSSPFTVQYSCPHVFQCSEVFCIISSRYVFASCTKLHGLFLFGVYRAASWLYPAQIKVSITKMCCMLGTRSPIGRVL